MTVGEWGVVIGIAFSGVGLVAPWVFKVHCKLAVLVEQIEKITRLLEKGEGIPAKCAVHDTQIGTLRREMDDLWRRQTG